MNGPIRRLAWLGRETWAGVRTRKVRALVVVGATAFAAGLLSFTTIATTLANQRVGEQFDAVTSSRIVVTRSTASEQFPTQATIERLENDALIDRDDEMVVASLPFLDVVGVYATLEGVELEGMGLDARAIQIGAVSPSGFPLVAQTTVGAGFTEAMDGSTVAVVSSDVAEHLEFPYRWAESYLFLGGRPYAVVGVADVDPPAGESWDILIPHLDGHGVRGVVAAARGELAAAEVEAVAVAVAGHNPEGVSVDVPLGPHALRAKVLSELAANTRRLGAAVLAAAVASISAIGLVTVLERRWEIGLRRALGATGFDIALQFMGEAVALGLFGGLVGACGGIVVAAILVDALSATLAEALLRASVVGSLLGAATGLVAGALPTALAVTVEPVDALRAR